MATSKQKNRLPNTTYQRRHNSYQSPQAVARNIGFVDSLKRDISMEVMVPDDPGYVGAIGAAVAAAAGVTGEKVEAKVVEKEDIKEGK